MNKRHIFIITSVLLVLIVGLVSSFWSLTAYYKRSTFDFLQKQARIIGRNLETTAFEFDDSLKYSITTGQMERFLEEGPGETAAVDSIRRFYSKHQDIISSIEVYNADSRRTVGRGKDNYFEVSSLQKNPERQTLRSRSEVVSGSPGTTYIAPIYNKLGDVVANIRVELDLPRFLKQQMLNYYIGEDSWIWCMDAQGRVLTVLYSGGHNRSQDGFRAAGEGDIQKDIVQQLEGSLEHVLVAGRDVPALSSYYPVSIFGESLGVILSMTQESLFEVVRSRIAVISAFFLGITLWVALVFSFVVYRMIRTEKKLVESEDRWQFALEGSGDGVWDWDLTTNKVFFSKRWKAMLGYQEHEIRNDFSEWERLVHPDDLPQALADVDRHRRGETPVYMNEQRMRAKDGTVRYILARGVVIRSADTGKPYRMVGTHTDITDIKMAEESLRVAKEEAEKALAVKNEFTSTVSHELRTPLSAMKSSVDILATEAPGPLTHDQKVFINRVKSNIDRLARLINEVLDLSKLESGKMVVNMVPLNVEALVRDVVDAQTAFVLSKGLTITKDVAPGLPVMVADRDRITQVLNNLINNALKFTQQGGITIAAALTEDRGFVFCVTDTGIGIKPEDTARLFEKFFQAGGASQQVGGTGLGLAICKEIVALHGGRIWVDSEFGKGSSFFFSIPNGDKHA